MTGILKCRLVSEKWNATIEEVLRNENAGHFDLNGGSGSASEYATYYFHTYSQVGKFLGQFTAIHSDLLTGKLKKCPFLGRAVEVEYDTKREENAQAYFNGLTEMFAKFGDQVYYFTFIWCGSHPVMGHVDIYLKIKQFVEQLPNLKVLTIQYLLIPSPSDEELEDLEEEMERNPFPEGTNLEMISVGQVPGVLANHLVDQNGQIKRLAIDHIDFVGDCHLFEPHKLANLTQLSLVEMESMEILEAFESYPGIFNLVKLQLLFSPEFPFVRWSRVFNAIDSKINSEIFTDLTLDMPRPTSDAERRLVLEDSLLCRLKLGNLQRCDIESYGGQFSLDFLLESKKSLREISIACNLAYEDDQFVEQIKEKQLIQFLGWEVNMFNSNIATVLDRLSKLTVYIEDRSLRRHYSIQPNGVLKVDKEEN